MHSVQGYRIYSKLSQFKINLDGDLVLKKIYDQHGIKISDSHPKLKFYKDMEFFNQFYFMS